MTAAHTRVGTESVIGVGRDKYHNMNIPFLVVLSEKAVDQGIDLAGSKNCLRLFMNKQQYEQSADYQMRKLFPISLKIPSVKK